MSQSAIKIAVALVDHGSTTATPMASQSASGVNKARSKRAGDTMTKAFRERRNILKITRPDKGFMLEPSAVWVKLDVGHERHARSLPVRAWTGNLHRGNACECFLDHGAEPLAQALRSGAAKCAFFAQDSDATRRRHRRRSRGSRRIVCGILSIAVQCNGFAAISPALE
jgi:hypothetical protein